MIVVKITSKGRASNLLTTILYSNGDIATTKDFKTWEVYPA